MKPQTRRRYNGRSSGCFGWCDQPQVNPCRRGDNRNSGLSRAFCRGTGAGDPLASWNDGPAKQAILDFVKATTDQASKDFVAPGDRIATFDQDGTLWVEHPLYSQAMFALDRVHTLAPQHPEWKAKEPFKSVLANDMAAMGHFSERDWAEIVFVTHAGMSQTAFLEIVTQWLATATHPRFKRPYTDLVYQPMIEVLSYLRANQFETFIVTGGGQDFVRAYSHHVLNNGDRRKFGGQAAIAARGYVSLVGWNFCPQPEPSVPL